MKKEPKPFGSHDPIYDIVALLDKLDVAYMLAVGINGEGQTHTFCNLHDYQKNGLDNCLEAVQYHLDHIRENWIEDEGDQGMSKDSE